MMGLLIILLMVAGIGLACTAMTWMGQQIRLNKRSVDQEIAKENYQAKIENEVRRETNQMLEEHRLAKIKRKKEREKAILKQAVEQRKLKGQMETRRIIGGLK